MEGRTPRKGLCRLAGGPQAACRTASRLKAQIGVACPRPRPPGTFGLLGLAESPRKGAGTGAARRRRPSFAWRGSSGASQGKPTNRGLASAGPTHGLPRRRPMSRRILAPGRPHAPLDRERAMARDERDHPRRGTTVGDARPCAVDTK
jgi:hypothetical protein